MSVDISILSIPHLTPQLRSKLFSFNVRTVSDLFLLFSEHGNPTNEFGKLSSFTPHEMFFLNEILSKHTVRKNLCCTTETHGTESKSGKAKLHSQNFKSSASTEIPQQDHFSQEQEQEHEQEHEHEHEQTHMTASDNYINFFSHSPSSNPKIPLGSIVQYPKPKQTLITSTSNNMNITNSILLGFASSLLARNKHDKLPLVDCGKVLYIDLTGDFCYTSLRSAYTDTSFGFDFSELVSRVDLIRIYSSTQLIATLYQLLYSASFKPPTLSKKESLQSSSQPKHSNSISANMDLELDIQSESSTTESTKPNYTVILVDNLDYLVQNLLIFTSLPHSNNTMVGKSNSNNNNNSNSNSSTNSTNITLLLRNQIVFLLHRVASELNCIVLV